MISKFLSTKSSHSALSCVKQTSNPYFTLTSTSNFQIPTILSNMKTSPWKPNFLSTLLVRALSFGVLVLVARFAYVITIRGKSCNSGDFCFFSVPETGGEDTAADLLLHYYIPTFHDLFAEEYLIPYSKSLCIGTLATENADALREIGVTDSISISKKPIRLPFDDNTFDLVFAGNAGLDRSASPGKFASEVTRTLKPGGFFVVHTAADDTYSFNSLLDLFNQCKFIRSHEINFADFANSPNREIVLRKEHPNVIPVNNTSAAGYKRELIKKLEPLLKQEQLRRNVQNIRYLPSMVDISFKHRYIYIVVGARNYGSSIGGWFKKYYPKQNKNFKIYAIEGDKAYHEEYRLKKGVTLLPFAAWIRNETLFFEISREASGKNEERVSGMGRVQSVHSSSKFVEDLNKIEGFDFAAWLKGAVVEKDFVVVKMDVEGSEFHLVERLVENGGIGLIDEMFIECHCNGGRRFDECLELFSSLRERGVFVHQL